MQRPQISDMEGTPLPSAEQMPLYAPERVVHVGQLERTEHASTSWDQEGLCLSVSEHPSAWRRITPLPGKEWEGQRADEATGRFLDALALTDTQHEAVMEWAIQAKLIEPATIWLSAHEDDELEAASFFVHETREQAMYEADDDEARVKSEAGYKALPALATYGSRIASQVGGRHSFVDDHVMIAYADQAGLDGVWWHENLDPASLSAPRGGICPSRLEEWQFRAGGEMRTPAPVFAPGDARVQL